MDGMKLEEERQWGGQRPRRERVLTDEGRRILTYLAEPGHDTEGVRVVAEATSTSVSTVYWWRSWLKSANVTAADYLASARTLNGSSPPRTVK